MSYFAFFLYEVFEMWCVLYTYSTQSDCLFKCSMATCDYGLPHWMDQVNSVNLNKCLFVPLIYIIILFIEEATRASDVCENFYKFTL